MHITEIIDVKPGEISDTRILRSIKKIAKKKPIIEIIVPINIAQRHGLMEKAVTPFIQSATEFRKW